MQLCIDEQWRPLPIADYREEYEVSSAGRIRSRARRFERILIGSACSNGYRSVRFRRGGRVFLVHRLVLLAFRPICNPEAYEVNHLNGRRDDNRLHNLAWVTSSENKIHAYRCLPRKAHSKTTPVALVGGGRRILFASQLDAARYLGVRPGSISSAMTRNHRCAGFTVEAA